MYLTCILHVFRMYIDVTVHIHQDTSRYPVHLYLFSVTLTIIGNVTRGLVAAVDHVAAMAMPIAGLECGETEKVAHRRTARSLVGGPFRADMHARHGPFCPSTAIRTRCVPSPMDVQLLKGAGPLIGDRGGGGGGGEGRVGWWHQL